MFYYKVDENRNVCKYYVNFDREALLKLREDLIEDYSMIISNSLYGAKDGLKVQELRSNPRVKNLKEKRYLSINSIKEEDLGVLYDIYEYTYDEYYYPMLADIIEDILNGKYEKIESINNCYEEDNIKYLNEKIEKLNNEIKELDGSNEYLKVEKICLKSNAVRDLEKNLYRDKKPYSDYIEELNNLIEYEYVSQMPLDNLLKVKDFMNSEMSDLEKTDGISRKK